MFTQAEIFTSYAAGQQAALTEVLNAFTTGGPAAAARYLADNLPYSSAAGVDAATLADTLEYNARIRTARSGN